MGCVWFEFDSRHPDSAFLRISGRHPRPEGVWFEFAFLQKLSTQWSFCFVQLTKVLNESCESVLHFLTRHPDYIADIDIQKAVGLHPTAILKQVEYERCRVRDTARTAWGQVCTHSSENSSHNNQSSQNRECDAYVLRHY